MRSAAKHVAWAGFPIVACQSLANFGVWRSILVFEGMVVCRHGARAFTVRAPALGRSLIPGQKEEIITHVCKRYGLAPEVLAQPGKNRNCAEARAVIALLAWSEDHLALIDLCTRLGRDPSSISRAVNRLRKGTETNRRQAAEREMAREDLTKTHI